MKRSKIRQGYLVVAATLLMSQGCAHPHYRATAASRSPGITEEDGRRHSRGGANPNAPFTLTTRVQTRTTSVRPNLRGMLDAAPCSPEDLAIVEVAEQVNGDERFVKLAFVNASQNACKIGGYPSLSLLDDLGVEVSNLSVVQVADESHIANASAGTSMTASASRAPIIELALSPGAEAYFGVSWVSGSTCPSVSNIVVNAPGMSRTFSINHPLTVCSGHIQITALRATQDAS